MPQGPGIVANLPDLHVEKRPGALLPGLQARISVSLSGFRLGGVTLAHGEDTGNALGHGLFAERYSFVLWG